MLLVQFLFRIADNQTRFPLALCKYRYVLVNETRRLTATRRTNDKCVQLARRDDLNISAFFLRADHDTVFIVFDAAPIHHLELFEFLQLLRGQPLRVFEVIFFQSDVLCVHSVNE